MCNSFVDVVTKWRLSIHNLSVQYTYHHVSGIYYMLTTYFCNDYEVYIKHFVHSSKIQESWANVTNHYLVLPFLFCLHIFTFLFKISCFLDFSFAISEIEL